MEHRISPRFISKNNTIAKIKFRDGQILEGKIYDISENGISLIIDDQVSNIKAGAKCKLIILHNNQISRKFDAKIKWKCEKSKKAGFEIFNESDDGNDYPPPLYKDSLIRIISDQRLISQLVIEDRKIVLREANIIKVCSSNYFMWTIGALIPLIAAIWTLFIQHKISPSSCSGIMLGMFILYCMSFFSIIEKARAINKREGFIAALDYCLITHQLPENYPGWIQLKHAFAECDAKRESKQCSLTKEGSCKVIGDKYSLINTYKRTLPYILDSFVSLTLLFYGFLYFIILLLSLVALSEMFNQNPFNINYWSIFLAFGLGYLVGISVGKNFILILLSIVLPIVIIFLHVVTYDNEYNNFLSMTYLCLVIFPLGFFYGSILNRILCQFIKLRKYEYSIESFFHIWLNIFKYCIFMPICPTNPKNKGKMFQKICDKT